MAAPQFRTTMSIVFWTGTQDEGQELADQITELVPEDYKDSTLTTISFISEEDLPPSGGE